MLTFLQDFVSVRHAQKPLTYTSKLHVFVYGIKYAKGSGPLGKLFFVLFVYPGKLVASYWVSLIDCFGQAAPSPLGRTTCQL